MLQWGDRQNLIIRSLQAGHIKIWTVVVDPFVCTQKCLFSEFDFVGLRKTPCVRVVCEDRKQSSQRCEICAILLLLRVFSAHKIVSVCGKTGVAPGEERFVDASATCDDPKEHVRATVTVVIVPRCTCRNARTMWRPAVVNRSLAVSCA